MGEKDETEVGGGGGGSETDEVVSAGEVGDASGVETDAIVDVPTITVSPGGSSVGAAVA